MLTTQSAWAGGWYRNPGEIFYWPLSIPSEKKLLPVVKDDERPQTKASNLQSCGKDSGRGLVTKELEGTSGSQVARGRS